VDHKIKIIRKRRIDCTCGWIGKLPHDWNGDAEHSANAMLDAHAEHVREGI
jgi:hypothetical protein